MFHWALQYGQRIEVKAPQSLRDRIKAATEEIASKYREENI
jgi:predicted DNA-binding transcriptional regulator YafY